MSERLVDRVSPNVGAPVVLLPVGSTEQHGPHLPLDTDTVVAEAVATALAKRAGATGIDVVVAPPIAYGSSGEHEAFPGTVSIGREALEHVLVEYGRSVCGWAARLVLVNGHGGNVEALASVVSRLVAEGRDVTWIPCEHDGGGDAHAGRTETSLMLHLAPDRVRLDASVPGNRADLATLMPELRRGGVAAVAPNGVLGDPSGASAEEGARLLEGMVERAWRRWSPTRQAT
ncbi:mycofactocin biosynthesis peptidyl-dipeptidase MftE [Georgenia alba]|uniref:Mycofactocin biosynthesis peptidyl-dipeptidase MftE n=1 Tax=Georgenia alba TaxID=2233858 RepID=A0ABW2Q5G0_9MICO